MEDSQTAETASSVEQTDDIKRMNDMLRDAGEIIINRKLATRTTLNKDKPSLLTSIKAEYQYDFLLNFTDDQGQVNVEWEGIGDSNLEGNREPFPQVKRVVFRNIDVDGEIGNPAIGANFRDVKLEMHLENGGIDRPNLKILDAIGRQITRVEDHLQKQQAPKRATPLSKLRTLFTTKLNPVQKSS